MQYGPPRGAERIYLKDGVMRDGRIVARKVRAYFDSGAYTRLSSYAVVKCAAHLPGPYTIPNVYGDVYCVFTNRTPATAMRGFGVTAMDFAIECQMDKLAHLVGMDPMEFRILNAYRDGDMKAHRREAKNTALIECVQVAAEKAKWPHARGVQARVVAQGRRRRARGDPADAARDAHRRRPRPRSSARPTIAPPRPPPAPRAAAPAAAARRAAARRAAPASHGATRFSSVFGTRRR